MTRTRSPRRRLRVARFVVLSLGSVAAGVGLYFFHKFQVYREAGAIRVRAAAAARDGNWPVSVSLYRNYLRLQPEDTAALGEFADSLDELVRLNAPGLAPELISTYERLRQFDSLSAGHRRKLAEYNLAAGRTAAAREALRTLLESPEAAPDDAGLLELAAACEEQERQVPAARRFYERAVATGKAAPETYLRLADLIRKDGANPDAEADAEKVLAGLVAARPADAKARLLRARYRLQRDQTQAARADLEYAYRSTPGGADDLEVVQTLAGMAAANGELALAQEVLAKARAGHPDALRIQLALADVQAQRRDAPAARATLLALAARDLPVSQLPLDVADRLLDLGEPAAVAALAARLAAGGAGYAGDYLTGRLKLAEGDWRAATPLLRRGADGLGKIPAHQAAALVGLADCYGRAGDKAARAKAVADAVRADPRSVRARLAQAGLLAGSGQAPAAIALYAQLAPYVPAARLALAELRVEAALAQPEAARDWAAAEAAFGPEPRPVELEVLRGTTLVRRGRAAEGVAALEKVVAGPDAAHLGGPAVALAYARGLQDPDAGLRVLADAEARVGDRAEFRLARLALTLRSGTVDLRAVAALGAATGPFPPAERGRLFAALGEAFAALNRPAEAVEFLRKAAAESPFDIGLRADLFQLAVQTQDAALQERMLQEMDALDGPGGPVRAVCEVARALRDVTPGDARVDELRARLEAARAARPDWPAAEVALANLDLAAGRAESALGHYRRALELGDEGDAVVAKTVELLRQGRRDYEAFELLGRHSRRANLSADLTRQLVELNSTFGQDGPRSLAWARAPERVNSGQYRDHLIRASVLEANGARAEARKAVEKALALNANAPEAWVTLVRLSAAEGKPAEAKAAAEAAARALKPVPGRPESAAAVALALGACHELAGDLARAEAADREALALAPTGLAATRQLNRLLHRAGRGPEADKLFADLAANAAAPPEARRYARRMLAIAKVMQSGAPAELTAALDLLDRNLQEGGNLIEDRRAKALVLATDPTRQPEAIALLTEGSDRTPLTAEESYYLGRMHLQQGRLDLAEAALTESTRAVALALPEHLAALAGVQCLRADTAAAAATVARLKANFAATWEAVSEEARLLALTQRRPEAAKLLSGSKFAGDPEALLKRVAPLCEEVGLGAEAEAVYRDAAKAGTPLAHTPLAGFLLRNGRAAEAVALAYAHEATAPVGVTARLLAGGARVLPVALAPEAGRAEWAAAVGRVEAWVTQKLALDASNVDVLFAKAELDDLAGRYADELATYEKLLALAPDNDTFLNNFAMVLALVSGDGGERPLGLVNAAVAKKGPRPTFLDTRAVVHLAGGRFDAAIADLAVALRLDPKPAYSFHLAQAEERKAGDKGPMTNRDAALREAGRRGLTKAMLHAKEWPDYDRLMPRYAAK